MRMDKAKKKGAPPGRPPARRAEKPAAKPWGALPGDLSDEALRKMTAAILEKLKSPAIPPSVTILQALQQVRDRALARRNGQKAKDR
jgi:hypothetical protein